MTDKELAKERFRQPSEGMRVLFIPQCCRCIHNIDKFTCAIYDDKPKPIMSNVTLCEDRLVK